MVGFFRNATWSAGVAAIRSFLGFLNTLLAVRAMGAQAYGHIATLLAFSALYVGITHSINTILVARLMALKKEAGPSMRSLIISAAVLLNVAALCFLVLFIMVTYWAVPGAFDLKDLWNPEQGRIVAVLLGGVTALRIIVALQSAVIESSGRLDLAMKSQLLGPFALAVMMAVIITLQPMISNTAYLGMLCIASGLDLFVLCWVRYRWLHLTVSFNGAVIPLMGAAKELLVSGGVLQAASLMNLFLEPLNKFLLNHYIGPIAVTAYDLAMKAIWGIQGLFGAAMRVFLHISHQDGGSIGRTYERAMQMISVPVVIIHTLGVIILYGVVSAWVNIHSWQLFAFYAVATVSSILMIAATPLYTGLIGRNDLVYIFRMHILLALINLASSILFIPHMGLVGAAAGLVIACLCNMRIVYRRHMMIFNYRPDWRNAFGTVELKLALYSVLFVFVTIIAAVSGSMWLMGALGILLVIALIREPLTQEIWRRLWENCGKTPGGMAR